MLAQPYTYGVLMASRAVIARPASSFYLQPSLRAFSSSASASASSTNSPSPRPSPAAAAAAPAAPSRLSWEEYLRLRKARRIAGLATSVPTTVFAGLGAGSFFLTQEIDPTQTIGGIEPLYIYGLATIACTGLGYLIGPSMGTSIWSLLHTSKLADIRKKDADFYEHIKRQRVDPSRSNMQNPVPDFYGEKISSLKEYRRWLRDCSVYRRKAAHGLKEDAPAGGI